MLAYAAYRRTQNIEFYSIKQKKHQNTCVYQKKVVNLQPKEKNIFNYTYLLFINT